VGAQDGVGGAARSAEMDAYAFRHQASLTGQIGGLQLASASSTASGRRAITAR
jgi:hypothetical protein